MTDNKDVEVKQEVREFYDTIGWKEVSDGVYQNARYEDLRPVSREYIHRCHLRVLRHLKPEGKYLLDAGSGPIQYPEYLEYSKGYQYRVCADISIVALQEARKRIGDHGLFVVADIAQLPFADNVFDGVVSLHTIHHLPIEQHVRAYEELYRVMVPISSAVVVNGWSNPPVARLFSKPIRWTNRLRGFIRRRLKLPPLEQPRDEHQLKAKKDKQKGTFVNKNNARWLKSQVGSRFTVEIFVWRSISVRFLRAFVHPGWGGKYLLRLIYWLEERFPRFLGENGQYPMVVIKKP